ncbi:hypothetical protein AGLY_004710 [Aphis glycines]|uniref:Uncharacterized protein n=1 Tax=Aphis glycines TaxID=307491 RepID=A0A6G0TUN9_APHGL|nr:hypothetical protein AGLY_004710 [Aphis glycines]
MCSKQISQYLIRHYCLMGNPFGSCDMLLIKISLNFSSKPNTNYSKEKSVRLDTSIFIPVCIFFRITFFYYLCSLRYEGINKEFDVFLEFLNCLNYLKDIFIVSIICFKTTKLKKFNLDDLIGCHLNLNFFFYFSYPSRSKVIELKAHGIEDSISFSCTSTNSLASNPFLRSALTCSAGKCLTAINSALNCSFSRLSLVSTLFNCVNFSLRENLASLRSFFKESFCFSCSSYSSLTECLLIAMQYVDYLKNEL